MTRDSVLRSPHRGRLLRRLVIGSVILATLLGVIAGPVASLLTPTSEAAPVLPPLPTGWPTTLQLGMGDAPGGAAALRASAPFAFRYQYLAGGVNTGNGWANWNPNGQFATNYIQESVQNGMTPVLTYYQILQSAPGTGGSEADRVMSNLRNSTTMTAYYNDLKLFMQRAGAFPSTRVVLHVEPDMWGYMQQRSTGDNAATYAVKVGSTGHADVAGLPDTAAGLAQAIVRLRNTYAPNVVLGYHMSIWGTGVDIQYSQTSDATTDALAARAAAFYRSLGVNFDLSFGEFSDRDAAYKQYVYNDGGLSWFNANDFRRHARFMAGYTAGAGNRLVLWQIPLGNTKMRAVNNTRNHYQDNRVEWLLGDVTRANLGVYRDAGVVAFLFGRGSDGVTCACDANNDGMTNPTPINGNDMMSLTSDDDGGYFRSQARQYYTTGSMSLAGGGVATVTPTVTPIIVLPTATAATATVVAPTATAATLQLASLASAQPAIVAPGQSTTVSALVTSNQSRTLLVDIEIYTTAGARVFQQFFDNQAFSAGVQRRYDVAWSVPSGAATGQYIIKVGIFGAAWNGLLAWNDAAGGVSVSTTAPTATTTPTPRPTGTVAVTATSTSTAQPTNTVVATATTTPTPKPTGTVAVTATSTPTLRPTNTVVATATSTPTPRPTNTVVATVSASPTPIVTIDIVPTLLCVAPQGHGTFMAYFGYNNRSGTVVNLPVGALNSFSPNPGNRNQPTSFAVGSQPKVVAVLFDGSRISWTLNGRAVQASHSSPRC